MKPVGLCEELRLRNQVYPAQKSSGGQGQRDCRHDEVDMMSQVTFELAGWLDSCQRPWLDSCFKAVLRVHADRVWLLSVKFQACKLEAHYEVREAYKRQRVCVSSAKQKLPIYCQSWERLWDTVYLPCSDCRRKC